MKKMICIVLIVITLFFILSGCSPDSIESFEDDSVSASETEEFIDGLDGPFAHQPFFCYNGILYVVSHSLGSVFTELPEGYSYVGETVNVGTIFGLKEMESNVSGSIYKNNTTSEYAIIAFPGGEYEDGLPRYVLCIPCEE
ncbi:MAG: hypothetical protein J6B86_04785 [Clostridia bacterium]|nr:hypothetical protein [Clostridia bacterium]